MRRPANENDLPFGTQIWPRDEGAPYADTIGLDLEAPFCDDRLRDAVVTIENGMSVFVTARSLDVLDKHVWRIVMAAFGGARAVH